MRKFVLVLFATGLIATAASAQTTYTYTGAPYTTATAPYVLGGNVTGTFTTLSPLPPFLPLTSITASLQTASFSDGVATRTLANSFVCSFKVATDGAGNITQWEIFLRQSPYTTGNPQHSIESSGRTGIITGNDLAGTGNAGASPCDPIVLTTSGATSTQGSWTDTNPLASTPATYTYTGAPYTTAAPPYTVGQNLTGTLTTANPLPPFLPLTDITGAIASVSFNDSVTTRTNANSFICSFKVATDGAGNITRWQITLRESPYTTGNPQHSIDSSGQPGPIQGNDLAGTGNAGVSPCDPFPLTTSANSTLQGSWTDNNPLGSTPTTYTYTGAPYTTASAPYTLGGNLTGTLTTANPLPPFLPLTDITGAIASFSFSDDVTTRTNANSFFCSFQVATDGAGNITRWQISLRESPYTTGNPQHSIDSTGQPGPVQGNDLAGTGNAGVSPCDPFVLTTFAASALQGSWTDTNPLASTPAVYQYTGDPYTNVLAPYALGGRVTGTITTANPLPANLPLTDITPSLVSLSFNDTIATRTLGNSSVCTFFVATNGLGQITQWQVLLRQVVAAGNPQHAVQSSGQPGVIEGNDLAGTGIAGASVCGPTVLAAFGSTSTQGTWIGGAAATTAIPTLDGIGLAVLSLLLAAVAMFVAQKSMST